MITDRGETVSDTLFAVGAGLGTTLVALRFFRHGIPFLPGVLAYFFWEGFYGFFEIHLVIFFVALLVIAVVRRFAPEPLKTWGAPGLTLLVLLFEGGGRPLPTGLAALAAFGYAYFYGRRPARATGASAAPGALEGETLLLGLVLALTFLVTKQSDLYLYLMYATPLAGFLLAGRQPAHWVVSSALYLNFIFLAHTLH